MISRSGEDQPVLGEPPALPDGIWACAFDRAFDPWSVAPAGLVPTETPSDGVPGPAPEDAHLADEDEAADDVPAVRPEVDGDDAGAPSDEGGVESTEDAPDHHGD